MELKPPMSYEEQLNKLIEHGIVVDDRNRAIDILKSVNYYRFTGYALQFRVVVNAANSGLWAGGGICAFGDREMIQAQDAWEE